MRTKKCENSLDLENVSINDVLPLQAARRDAIANLKCFLGLRDTSNLISIVSLCGATLFGSQQRHLPPSVWLGSVRRPPCATPGNEAERTIYGGWVKTSVLF